MSGAPEPRPEPSATGNLTSTPFSNVLIYARNKRLTGTLELRAPDGREASITLWRGRIAGARTTPPTLFLGALVYELGLIDAQTLDATLLVVAQTKRLHGEVLVERGALTATQRDSALREQACRKVHHCFELPPETTFAFYDARPSAAEPAIALDPLAPLWRGIREHPPEKSVRDVMDRYAPSLMRLVNEGPLDRVGFAPDERDLVDELARRPMNLAQMRLFSSMPTPRVELVLYLLLISKCVEPVSSQPSQAASVPPSGSARPPVASGPRVAPSNPPWIGKSIPPTASQEFRMRAPSFAAPSVTRMAASSVPPPAAPRIPSEPPVPVLGPSDLGAAGIAARAQTVAHEDYFEALGVADGSSVEVVRAAYFRLAKVWHPDRLAADLAASKGDVETVFAHLTRAHRTLTDSATRRAYLAQRAERAPRRPRADVVRDIDGALAKADFASAEAEARRLHGNDPDDAEALAIVAWATSHAGDGPEHALRAALPMLDRAVNADRYCERAYFYRGMIHKKLGNGPSAFRDFSRAAQIDPKHVDAQREVRLYEMRARKGSGEHALGLFSKTKK